MKSSTKQAWLKALRNRWFRQNPSKLRSNMRTFNAGGMLAYVSGQRWTAEGTGYALKHSNALWCVILPAELERDLGLSSADSHSIDAMEQSGATFSELADWIEKNVVTEEEVATRRAQEEAELRANQEYTIGVLRGEVERLGAELDELRTKYDQIMDCNLDMSRRLIGADVTAARLESARKTVAELTDSGIRKDQEIQHLRDALNTAIFTFCAAPT